MNLPLYPIPHDDWQKKYDEVISDPYIATKYNRDTRLKNKFNYVNEFIIELNRFKNGRVLDIGTGPAEFLEVCRYMGFDVFGMDAEIGKSEMGDNYLLLSKLMTERQKLNVSYAGLDFSHLPFEDNDFILVNLQGSIEQVFKDYMVGVPHRIHKNAGLLSWDIGDRLKKDMGLFLREVYRVLRKEGILMVYGNGAKNVKDYDKMMVSMFEEIGFEIILNRDDRIHKVKK